MISCASALRVKTFSRSLQQEIYSSYAVTTYGIPVAYCALAGKFSKTSCSARKGLFKNVQGQDEVGS